MADDDKPLQVSANDKLQAQRACVWQQGSPYQRNRLRAGVLAQLHEMAIADRAGCDKQAFDAALEVQRLAALLVQHIDESGV